MQGFYYFHLYNTNRIVKFILNRSHYDRYQREHLNIKRKLRYIIYYDLDLCVNKNPGTIFLYTNNISPISETLTTSQYLKPNAIFQNKSL